MKITPEVEEELFQDPQTWVLEAEYQVMNSETKVAPERVPMPDSQGWGLLSNNEYVMPSYAIGGYLRERIINERKPH